MSNFISKLSLATILIGATFIASNTVSARKAVFENYSCKDITNVMSHWCKEGKIENCKEVVETYEKSCKNEN